MALLSSCLCCSLLLGSIIGGVYTAMVYLVAFIISVWWIVEAEVSGGSVKEREAGVPPIPAPAYLLSLGYIIVAAASVWMLLGLYKRKARALLVWVLVMTLFCFPEMGMVAFMTFVHWRITSTYGAADLAFYVFRAACNVMSVLCVQSQYVRWRDELVHSRTVKTLHHLHHSSGQHGGSENGETTMAYHNPAFIAAPEPTPCPPVALTRSYSQASEYSNLREGFQTQELREAAIQQAAVGGGRMVTSPPVRMGVPGWDPYVTGESQSEFNAAMFTPSSLGFLPLVTGCSRSEAALHQAPVGGVTVYHHTPQLLYPYPAPSTTPADLYYSTHSLDRRRYSRGNISLSDGLSLRAGVLATPGFFRPAYESRSSLGADSDDLRQYRDVAL
nr:uncharacterized protein LOC123764735 [Procambarus clarkii]